MAGGRGHLGPAGPILFPILGRLKDNTIVTTVMSNLGLYKACDKIGMKYEQTAVGDKYVYENMQKNGHRIGGEQSGHIIFSKYATTGDGILTSIKMMEVILAKKCLCPSWRSCEDLSPGTEKCPGEKQAGGSGRSPGAGAVNAVAEKLGDTGRILVRESGTEPVIRVMVEAESEELCGKYVDQVIAVIRDQGT